jgi:hypothetical protein
MNGAWKYPMAKESEEAGGTLVITQLYRIHERLRTLSTEFYHGDGRKKGTFTLEEFCNLEEEVETLGRMLFHQYKRCPMHYREVVKTAHRRAGKYVPSNEGLASCDKCMNA